MIERLLERRPTPAMLVASIALFVSLGGVSYGVATGSIDSRELKNNTVRSKDIRNNDIQSTDVRNGSLLSRDFKTGQLPAGPRGATGSPGPTGPPGSTGATGTPGAPGAGGVSGYELVSAGQTTLSIPGDTTALRSADCPAGKRAVGGGADISATVVPGVESFQVLHSARDSGDDGKWRVSIRNTDSAAHTLSSSVSVICVTALP